MATVRVKPSTGNLFLDFHYNGKRYREFTKLQNTATNKRKLERLGERIEKEIAMGEFVYHKHFPTSAAGKRFAAIENESKVPSPDIANSTSKQGKTNLITEVKNTTNTPLFKDFVQVWFEENKIGWRASHIKNIQGMIRQHYLPRFGEREVSSISRAELLKFRSDLGKVQGRNKNKGLSANRINKIMDPLRRVFEEAADRFEFNTPFIRIKPLKIQKSDVHPFSLNEVLRIINSVRPDYQNYYIVRFFTGMRTGEIDGLKWKYIDFEKRQILIRKTIVDGKEDYTKTDSSQREIQMSEQVYTVFVTRFVRFIRLQPLVL